MKPEDIEPAPPGWVRYYFTLGGQYNRKPHPRLRMTAEDVVYVTISAEETNDPQGWWSAARTKWTELLGDQYAQMFSNQYDYEQMRDIAHYFNGQCVPIEQVLWPDFPDDPA